MFRHKRNVDVIAFVQDLDEALDPFQMCYSEKNLTKKIDLIVTSLQRIAETHMPVTKCKEIYI